MAKRKAGPRFVRHEDVMREQMRDPAFRAAYEERRLVHEVALAVRSLRERAGSTQEQLAKKIGVSQPVIGRIEKSIGYRTPSWETLRKVFLALGYQLKLQLVESRANEPLVEIDGAPPRIGMEAANGLRLRL